MTYNYNSISDNKPKNNFDFTFNLNKYFTNNSKKDTDYTTSILNKINALFPWTKNDIPDKYINIDLPIELFTTLNITPEALNLEWNKAASNLYNFIYYTNHPSYDFKIAGVPVKIHGNYIQIGSKIVPKYTKSSFFKDFTKKDRIILYNISLSINSIELSK